MILATAVVSAFMSNAATVALLLPVVATLCRRARLAPSRMLLPTAYAATLAGTITVMGTRAQLPGGRLPPRAPRDERPDRVFDFAPVGLAVTAVGALFLVTLGRRLLPRRTSEERLREARLPEDVAQSYGLAQNLFLLRLAPSSPLVGKSIVQAAVRTRYGLDVVSIRRPGRSATATSTRAPPSCSRAATCSTSRARTKRRGASRSPETLQFGLAGPQTLENILGRGVTMVEATVAPNGEAVGRTFKELDLGRRFGVNVLSVWRGRRGPRARRTHASPSATRS